MHTGLFVLSLLLTAPSQGKKPRTPSCPPPPASSHLLTTEFVAKLSEEEVHPELLTSVGVVPPPMIVTAQIAGLDSRSGPSFDGRMAYGERFTRGDVEVDVYVRRLDCASNAGGETTVGCQPPQAGSVSGARAVLMTLQKLAFADLPQDACDSSEPVAGTYLGHSAFSLYPTSQGKPVEAMLIAHSGYEWFLRVVGIPDPGPERDGIAQRTSALLRVMIKGQPNFPTPEP